MKLLFILIALTLSLSVPANPSPDHFAGKSWDIKVISGATDIASPACVVFYPGGRFVMSDRTLTMLWERHPFFPNVFSAVTSRGERTVTHTHRGVYGYVTGNDTLYGSVLDQDGKSFEFEGRLSSYCSGEPAGSATDAVAETGSASNPIALLDLVDVTAPATLVDPCSISWCGPPDYLLKVPSNDTIGSQKDRVREAKGSSKLNGKFFQFTMPGMSGEEERHCWYFGVDRVIDTVSDSALVWVPEAILSDYVHGFQSIGESKSGYSLAFQGALIASDLLYVQGIRALNNEAVMTYGYGTEQAHCEPTEEFY